jgi:hypothetical protein
MRRWPRFQRPPRSRSYWVCRHRLLRGRLVVKLQIEPDHPAIILLDDGREVQMTHDQREIHRKKRIIEQAERIGNVKKACRYFGVARSGSAPTRVFSTRPGEMSVTSYRGTESRRPCAPERSPGPQHSDSVLPPHLRVSLQLRSVSDVVVDDVVGALGPGATPRISS